MAYAIHIDCFSGALSDLKKKDRTLENALRVLSRHSRVSTWDMGELPWMRGLVEGLVFKGWIVEFDEPYPWHRFELTDAGRSEIGG